MVLGAQRQNDLGAVVLCTSPDGLHWSPGGAIGLSEEYQMMECHDLFELDGAPVLLYCPQHRDNTADATLDSFSVGRVLEQWPDAARPLDLDTGWQRLDDGFDFYAPQTFRNRILQNESILKQHRILPPADTAGEVRQVPDKKRRSHSPCRTHHEKRDSGRLPNPANLSESLFVGFLGQHRIILRADMAGEVRESRRQHCLPAAARRWKLNGKRTM